MSANDPQSAPITLLVGLFVLLGAMYFAVLSSRKTKRTWSTMAATFGFLLLAAIINGMSLFGVPNWRLEALALMASDLVVVVLLSCICLAQAGRLGRRGRRMPLELVARRPGLQAVLAVAPLLLLTSWLVAGAILLVRPAPVLEVFDPAPPHLLLAALVSGLPEAAYFALTGWVFLKTSRSGAPSKTLRIKNFSLSAGCFAWALLVTNATTEAGVRVFARDGIREQLVIIHRTIEQSLTLLSLVAFGLGLTLRYVPAVGQAVIAGLPDLLGLRDRVETRKWHLVNAGKVRRLTRASHHATEAAARLGFSQEGLEKCLNTVQLTAILADRTVEPERRITPEMLRELRDLQQKVTREDEPSSRVERPETSGVGPTKVESLASSAPLNDALEAALILTQPSSSSDERALQEDRGASDAERLIKSYWYHLAAITAADAGFVPERSPGRSTAESITYRRTLRAFEASKNAAKHGLARGN